MSESGSKCLLTLAQALPVSVFVASVDDAAQDPHPMCRKHAAVCLNALLMRCEGDCSEATGARQDDDMDAICAILRKLLEDVSADVRASSKAAFETLNKKWPARGDALLSAAPDNIRRMLSTAGGGISAGKAGRAHFKNADIKGMRLAAMQRLKGQQVKCSGNPAAAFLPVADPFAFTRAAQGKLRVWSTAR